MAKRALITGITGQDGSYLAELLLAEGYEVFGMVRRLSSPNTWRIEHILDRITLRPADLLDQLSLLRLIDDVRPQEIYNLAAMSFVPASWDQPMLTGEFNSQGVTRMLDAVRRVDPKIRFYQASSSEMFGKVREVPQTELTPFYPRSPYGVSKVFAHYITVNYRESYDLFAVSGMLFNHESPRRGLEFVTRKVTDAVARIKLGLQERLSIGNLEAHRDWGFAGDYVRAMWLMLQQDEADDFVIATGVSHSVRELIEIAFARVGLEWQQHVYQDPALLRPAEVDHLLGDSRKAQKQLAWTPNVNFKQLIEMMVDADLERVGLGRTMSHAKTTLLERIRAKQARVGIIGLGYVGLPLAVEFARAGFDVTGFDIDASKIERINAGASYIPDVPDSELAAAVKSGRLRATTDLRRLGDMDAIDICVPTPLRKTRDPDLSYIVKAVEAVARTLRAGQLVILESTTYPGTTDEVVQPMLEANGLKADVDFLLAFSPERVDPGNAHFTTRLIPKVVGGVGPDSTEAAATLYASVVTTVVPVGSTRVAEMVKLLENTFRAVNIGLVNEIAMMCNTMGIDVWEVIDAAKTKPFGFMPFYPGPGLGGHCIPIDPFYLSWKARQSGFECRFIELAGQVNGAMPEYVVRKIGIALNSVRKPVNGSRVHLFGASYKRDVNDVRESPSLDIMELLTRSGAQVSYTDPYVPSLSFGARTLESVDFDDAVESPIDCAVVATDHQVFDYRRIAAMPLVVDTRNALGDIASPTIFRL